MSKILSKIFPLFDYLYLFQVLEYQPAALIRWFLQHPFARNMQKKHRLEYTAKIKLLLIFSLLWIYVSLKTIGFFLTFLALIFTLPAFIILAYLTLLPLDFYLKRKILNAAKAKLASLPKLKTIAITGSFGKTSTKDILYTLLWKKFRVVKTPKSYNTPLGLAQTILENLKPDTDIFIAEIGAYKRGEIEYLTKLLQPAIGMITGVAPQHLERFGSLENIARAKFELVENLQATGVAVLNGESEHLKTLAPPKVIFYGDNSRYFASDINVSIKGTSFIFHTPADTTKITLPLAGENHVKNFVGAGTVALILGLSVGEIEKRAAKLLPTPHRLEIKKQGSITVIDNTYNTNPASSQTSLQLLAGLPAPNQNGSGPTRRRGGPGSQKILITPGLVELGYDSSKENRKLAKEASKIADQIIIVGEYAKKDLLAGLAAAKFPRDRIFKARTLSEATRFLEKIARPNAVVLLENDLPDQYL